MIQIFQLIKDYLKKKLHVEPLCQEWNAVNSCDIAALWW